MRSDPTQILELIRSRRCIGSFGYRSIPDDHLIQILEAGRWASSGFNSQPWRFLVIRDFSTIALIK